MKNQKKDVAVDEVALHPDQIGQRVGAHEQTGVIWPTLIDLFCRKTDGGRGGKKDEKNRKKKRKKIYLEKRKKEVGSDAWDDFSTRGNVIDRVYK